MNCYTEILKLDGMLSEAGIPHTLHPRYGGWQILYPSEEARVLSAIEHRYSSGRYQDTIEIMGLLTAKERAHYLVKGYMTANEVFARIKAHYDSQRISDEKG
jgi:hypothetical protein